MGLRSSSLTKKNDDTLTWVLHKRDHTQRNIDQNFYEIEKTNVLAKQTCANSTSPAEYQSREYNSHVQRKRNNVRSNIFDYGKRDQTYGYGITDLDDFLSKASVGRPGNIPMVLCTACLLYQTQLDDHYQTEVALPLGMVVNAVFKNEQWLYVQTPHAEEGYIPYGSCLPLGIVPPPEAARPPCWETQSDVFPRPVGDRRPQPHRNGHRGGTADRGHHCDEVHRGAQRRRPVASSGSVAGDCGRDDGDVEDDVATSLFRRRLHCSGSDTASSSYDGGRRSLWAGGGRIVTADPSITGYGCL